MDFLDDIEFKDIQYSDKNKKCNMSDSSGLIKVNMFKTTEDFFDLEYLVRYIKKIERLVRSDERYKDYKSILLDKGYNKCAILGNITTDMEDVDIEMHHGPILTLFDIVFIVLNHKLNSGEKISTFRIAKEVLDIHFKDLVQVVMLSKTFHEQEHDDTIFINLKQCASGDILSFLELYHLGITEEHRDKIMEYFRLSQEYDVYTGDLTEVADRLVTWNI